MVFHLLVRAELIPYEELKSYLNRTGEINHYYEKSWYLDLVGLGLNRDISQSKSIEVFSKLSELTMLDIHDLISMTPNRFTEFFYPQHKLEDLRLYETPKHISYRLPGDNNPKYFSGTRGNTRKICPLCLQQNHAFLLPWSVKFITTCPYHNIKLIDICPKCHKQIFLKNYKCAYCGTSINTFDNLETQDNIGNLLSILTWKSIGCNPFSEQIPMIPLTHHVYSISPNSLINLIWQLLLCMNYLYPEATKTISIGSSSLARIHKLLREVVKLFIDWPNNWVKFCQDITQREKDDISLRNNRHIFPHNLHSNFSGKDYEWLIEPLKILQYGSDLVEKNYWRIFFNQINAVVDRNKLIAKNICINEGCDIKDFKVIYDYFDFSMANSLVKILDNYRVNFSKVIVKSFINEIYPEILMSKKERIRKNLNNELKIAGNNFHRVQNFFSKNLCLIELEDEQNHNFVAIKIVYSSLQKKGFSFLQICFLVLFSVIPVFKIKFPKEPDAIVIRKEDFNQLLESTNNHSNIQSYSLLEVGKLLNCSSKILKKLSEYHQLEPIDSSLETQEWQYSKKKVDKFQWKKIPPTTIHKVLNLKESTELLISNYEAAQILQVSQHILKKFCREGVIYSLFGFGKDRNYMFRRSEIITLRNNHYYRFEVTKVLRICSETLVNWKKNNFLVPVFDNLHEYNIYLKTDVDKLIGTRNGRRYLYGHVRKHPNIRNVFSTIKNELSRYQLLLHPLNDDQWQLIEDVFNHKNHISTSKRTVSNKTVINSILHAIRNNVALRNCPSGYTCYKWLRKWEELGLIDELIDELVKVFSNDEWEKPLN